jgi:molecular chaperone GrpE
VNDERDDDLFDPDSDDIEVMEAGPKEEGEAPLEAEAPGAGEEDAAGKIRELDEKYLRLYAEFENYRKRMARDKEELAKYATESLLQELLPSLDHLDIALRHVEDDAPKGLVEGVEMTLRELYRTLEKFGVTPIEAEGRAFDPAVHHAVAQVERDDMEEQMVVEELRKGFRHHDKVLRAAMVSVSKKPERGGNEN